MPTKEIKELRQSGKLKEAYSMAKAELDAQPDNIWAKRNISWVYYDYLKQNIASEDLDAFILNLSEIKNLELSDDEKILFDNVAWQIGSLIFKTLGKPNFQYSKLFQLYEITKYFSFSKPSEGYSFLFKALHKFLKGGYNYLQFADWWNFENFREEDYLKEKLPNGKEVMSIVEQAYITYAKHLLPKETVFNKEKALLFIDKLTGLEDKKPEYQYPPYLKAKLLLALGDKDQMLEALLPFAKKKRNDFWVWEILAEAYSSDAEKVFACYCKALSCKSPEEMLISLRQKMAKILISKQKYNEAKTEIELLVKARNEKEYNIPNEVIYWQSEEWFKNATAQKFNFNFYNNYIIEAESILFYDIPEETVIVESVNTDKRILNFIASESKFGFTKYDKFFKDVKIGDTLKVRFQGGKNEGMNQLFTCVKIDDDSFKSQFLKDVEGSVRIVDGKIFGFLGDIFIHPSLVTKLKLTNGMHFKGKAIKSFNKEKKQWSWKLI